MRYALTIAAILLSPHASAIPTVHVASAKADLVPLVVVLHGDHEDSSASRRRWEAAVEARGWDLLAPDCPTVLGCVDGSWYRWNGDPVWLRGQVRLAMKAMPIDPSRIYLVGWSGGATYIGQHIQDWPDIFAAVVIHGGGVAPVDDRCVDATFPAYFLVGDKNPDHSAAKQLRDYFDRCGQEEQWDLVPGANHTKEDAALTEAKAESILRWLDARRRDDAVS